MTGRENVLTDLLVCVYFVQLYLVELLSTVQLIVALRHRLVQSGLNLLQLQHVLG